MSTKTNPYTPPAASGDVGPGPRRIRWVAPAVVIGLVALLALRSWWAEGDRVYDRDCVSRCVEANTQLPEDEADNRVMCTERCKAFARGELSREPSQLGAAADG